MHIYVHVALLAIHAVTCAYSELDTATTTFPLPAPPGLTAVFQTSETMHCDASAGYVGSGVTATCNAEGNWDYDRACETGVGFELYTFCQHEKVVLPMHNCTKHVP